MFQVLDQLVILSRSAESEEAAAYRFKIYVLGIKWKLLSCTITVPNLISFIALQMSKQIISLITVKRGDFEHFSSFFKNFEYLISLEVQF